MEVFALDKKLGITEYKYNEDETEDTLIKAKRTTFSRVSMRV
nr:MAG TPA_asm: hypothetical protein [Caudoviricetes sp.]